MYNYLIVDQLRYPCVRGSGRKSFGRRWVFFRVFIAFGGLLEAILEGWVVILSGFDVEILCFLSGKESFLFIFLMFICVFFLKKINSKLIIPSFKFNTI